MSDPRNALFFEYLEEHGGKVYQFALSSIYITGNIIPSLGVTDPSKDNWFLFVTNHYEFDDFGNPVPQENRRRTPLEPAPIPVTIAPALTNVDSVLAGVGANKRLKGDGTLTNTRDEVDQSFVKDFYDETGPMKPVRTLHTPSSINPGTPYTDTDQDGMADAWENLHFGNLGRGSAVDSSSDLDRDGYTDLEEFLNSTDPKTAATRELSVEEAELLSKKVLNVREEVRDDPYLAEAVKVFPVKGYP